MNWSWSGAGPTAALCFSNLNLALNVILADNAVCYVAGQCTIDYRKQRWCAGRVGMSPAAPAPAVPVAGVTTVSERGQCGKGGGVASVYSI